MNSIDRIAKLLRPRSIAIAGATEDQGKIVGRLLPVLTNGGYTGKIYPVNPRYTTVQGLPCYPSVDSIPGEIDHCIIAVPQAHVPSVIAECRAKHVPGASIYTSGYAEAGGAGAEAQAELLRLAGDMIFIGPNCMGFANLIDRVVATASQVVAHDSTAGDVGLITQSGGLGYASFGYVAQQMGLRFSYMVNTGNSAGIATSDLIEFMFDDVHTKVIVVIVERESVVGEMLDLVRRRGMVKPIVLFKLGRGETGARMALSHTGSLAGDYRLARDLAEQHGIVCTDDVDDTLGAASLLRAGFTGHHANGLAALSISGGNITLLADQVDAIKLSFAALSPVTEQRLKEMLPDFITIHNPVDITSFGVQDATANIRVAEVLMADPSVRTLVPIITTMPDYTPVCSQFAEFKRRTGCPMIALWTGGAYEDRSPGILRDADIPIFKSSGNLARSLDRLRRAYRADESSAPALIEGRPIVQLDLLRPGPLTESESFAFLAAADIPVPRIRTTTRAALAKTAAEVGYPIVIKIDVDQTHVSDQGGVILGIENEEDLARAAPRIAAMQGERLLVSQYLPGHEIVASIFRHATFGMMLMLGSGGALVEILSDVRFLHLPASRTQLAAALADTLIGRVLKTGFRGASGFDAAVNFIEKLSALAIAAGPKLAQVELNPVTVGKHGAVAVDAAVIGTY